MHLRRYFLAGVGFLLPIGIVFIFLKAIFFVVSGVSRPFLQLFFSYFLPEARIDFVVSLVSALFTLTIIAFTGFILTKFFGKAIAKRVDQIFKRVPGIGDLYSAVKKLTGMVTGNDEEGFGKQFKSVVLAEWPAPGSYAMGLVTAEHFQKAKQETGKELVVVFIPTPPNPINGLLVMIPKERITLLDMRVDEAIKIIFSLGLAA